MDELRCQKKKRFKVKVVIKEMFIFCWAGRPGPPTGEK
jgi:hypothetical protein